MKKSRSLTELSSQDMQSVFDYIDSQDCVKPKALGSAKEAVLGKIFELDDEFLVAIPPDLAFGVPKGPGVTVKSLREELIRVVAAHIKLIE